MQHFSYNNGKTEHKKDGVKPSKRMRTLFVALGAVMVMSFTSGCATMNNPYSPGSPEYRRVEAQNEGVKRQVSRSGSKAVEGMVEEAVKGMNVFGNSKWGKIFGTGVGRAAGDAAAGGLMGIFGRDQQGRKIDQGHQTTGRVYDMSGGQQNDTTVVQPQQGQNGKKTYTLKR